MPMGVNFYHFNPHFLKLEIFYDLLIFCRIYIIKVFCLLVKILLITEQIEISTLWILLLLVLSYFTDLLDERDTSTSLLKLYQSYILIYLSLFSINFYIYFILYLFIYLLTGWVYLFLASKGFILSVNWCVKRPITFSSNWFWLLLVGSLCVYVCVCGLCVGFFLCVTLKFYKK